MWKSLEQAQDTYTSEIALRRLLRDKDSIETVQHIVSGCQKLADLPRESVGSATTRWPCRGYTGSCAESMGLSVAIVISLNIFDQL